MAGISGNSVRLHCQVDEPCALGRQQELPRSRQNRAGGDRLPGLWSIGAGESGEQMKKVAIIGAGLQAKRRSGPIADDPKFEISVVVDRDEKKARRLADSLGAAVATDW